MDCLHAMWMRARDFSAIDGEQLKTSWKGGKVMSTDGNFATNDSFTHHLVLNLLFEWRFHIFFTGFPLRTKEVPQWQLNKSRGVSKTVAYVFHSI